MKLSTIVPILPAAMAMELVYTPPMALTMKAQSDENCNLPADFNVKELCLKSNDHGKSLSSYEFTFTDKTTKIETLCQWNQSSVSSTPAGLTPRFACTNRFVQFIYTPARQQFTMIESACPRSADNPGYEASGSFNIYYQCSGASYSCHTNQTNYHAMFTSLQPSPKAATSMQ